MDKCRVPCNQEAELLFQGGTSDRGQHASCLHGSDHRHDVVALLDTRLSARGVERDVFLQNQVPANGHHVIHVVQEREVVLGESGVWFALDLLDDRLWFALDLLAVNHGFLRHGDFVRVVDMARHAWLVVVVGTSPGSAATPGARLLTLLTLLRHLGGSDGASN